MKLDVVPSKRVFCKDCKHFNPRNMFILGPTRNEECSATKRTDPVYGDVSDRTNHRERNAKFDCCWFERKEPGLEPAPEAKSAMEPIREPSYLRITWPFWLGLAVVVALAWAGSRFWP